MLRSQMLYPLSYERWETAFDLRFLLLPRYHSREQRLIPAGDPPSGCECSHAFVLCDDWRVFSDSRQKWLVSDGSIGQALGGRLTVEAEIRRQETCTVNLAEAT